MVSIVIPVFNDTDALERTLASLRAAAGPATVEIIVVATSADRASLSHVRESSPDIRWAESARGRAKQMNAGAALAGGDWLIFLHADTRLPPRWPDAIAEAEGERAVSIGCFRFALDSRSPAARILEFGVRARVAVFGLPYGDQALFVRRHDFLAAGGYADVPIMEDVDLVRRLRRRGRLYCAPHPAVTSARKWEKNGWIRQSVRHLRLILLYFLGVTPDRLAASI